MHSRIVVGTALSPYASLGSVSFRHRFSFLDYAACWRACQTQYLLGYRDTLQMAVACLLLLRAFRFPKVLAALLFLDVNAKMEHELSAR